MASIFHKDHASSGGAGGMNGSANANANGGQQQDIQGAAQAAQAVAASQAAQAAAQAEVVASAASAGGPGSTVMQFDENASPEEKAAAARAAASGAKGGPMSSRPPKASEGTGMASDIGGKKVKTTLNLDDIDRVSKAEGQLGGGKTAAGAVAAGTTQVAGVHPDAVVGWNGVSHERTKYLDPPLSAAKPPPPPGMAAPGEISGAPVANKAGGEKATPVLNGRAAMEDAETFAEKEAKKFQWETDLVGKYISDSQLGYFWFNGASMLVAVLATYFLTRFGAGVMGLLVVGAFCSTYYNASMRRTRQRHRDDISRELAKKKMASEHETAEWINHFMARFWLIYEPVLSATIIATVDSILVANCPSFLDSIRMTTFTLGTKAPKIEHVRTFPDTEEDIVMMDWKFSFTPNDTMDMTVRQAARKINPKIVLTVRIGRSFVGAGFPILLEDMTFVGNIRLRMKLMSNFPHVQTVDVSFMEPPHFDYVLKPIGGNTLGFDINNIPGLSNFIQDQVHANLGPMMYNPNVFTLNLEELLSGTPLDTACGVLQVTIFSARNLKGVKFGGGQPDPYVAVSIDNKDTLAKTRYKHSTTNPQFKETKFILLNNLNGMLTLALMDYNDRRHDSHLGTAAWELKELMEQPEHESLSTPVMLDGKERGQVQYSLSYYPVIIPEKGPDGKNLPLPETRSGVVRLTIHQAKELDKRGTILGDLSPKARVLLNGNRVKDSVVIKRTDSPIWEMNVEFLVTERRKAVVGIEILNGGELSHDPVNSYLSVKLDDLLAAKERQQDWFPLTNSKRGRIRMSAQWKPVLMSGSMNGGSGYTPAIGAVKFWMHKATDVKNVEATLGGKSDPYAQLKVRGQITDRSTIMNNNLNPVWNEILYCPVRSLKDKITIEVMDYQNNGKDRSIGTTEIDVTELARESGDSTLPYTGNGRKLRKAKLDLGRNLFKGEIEYECEFLPAVALRGVEFEGAGNEAAAKAALGPLDGDEGGDPEGSGEGQSEDERRKMTQVTVTGGSTDEGVAEAKEVQAVKHDQQNGHKRTESTATVATPAGTAPVRAGSIKRPAAEGMEIPPEQLLKAQSGILVFNILGGNVTRKNARLEILFDDGYWPTYVTEAGRTERCTWDEVGESVIKELDWSRMWLKLRTGRGDTQEDVFAEFQANTKDILERALNKEAEFSLQPVEGSRPSTVKIICKYIPMDIQLEPVESVNNQGFLRLEVISAKNLRAADRGKNSDPYAVFRLNGERKAKSKTIKKSLNPEWNEDLGEHPVGSRVAAEAIIDVLDWDQVGSPDPLGEARLDLAALEPFDRSEVTLPLTGKGAGDHSPSVTVRMVFKPDFVTHRERKGTSIARTMTSGIGGVAKVGGAGVKGVGQAGMFVGKTAFGVPKGAFNLATGRNRRKSVPGVPDEEDLADLSGAGAAPALPAMPAFNADGLPVIPSSASGLPISPASGHFQQNSAGIAPSIGDESFASNGGGDSPHGKRKSRIHNPFKKHQKDS